MVDITIETFWQANVAPSSTSYATKETLDEARAFAQSQAAHYNAQGFTVNWEIFERNARIEAGESVAARYRQMGHAFFYYHQTCGQWRDDEQYAYLPVADCHPETWCCGCWGLLHEAPRTEV